MKNDITDRELKSVPKKRIGRKILLWSLGIVVGGTLIMLGIAAWVCAAMFDPEPLKEIVRQPDPQHLKTIAKKFGIDQDTEDKNELVSQILNLFMQQTKTVDLTKDEVNAVLDSAAIGGRIYLAKKLPRAIISDLRFKNGALHADASYQNDFSTPFGKYLNMKITLIPRVSKNHLLLDVENLSVGSMVISNSRLQEFINTTLKDFEKTPDGKTVLGILTDLQISRNNVKITFNPQQMTLFIAQKLGSNSQIMQDMIK